MKRRDFITLVGGTATWPLAARAQQAAMPIIGLVNPRSAEDSLRLGAAFRKALNETGYIEGQNVMVEYHWLEGQYDRVPALMADLVRRRVAVISTPAFTAAAPVAKAATTTTGVPIPHAFRWGASPSSRFTKKRCAAGVSGSASAKRTRTGSSSDGRPELHGAIACAAADRSHKRKDAGRSMV